MIGGMRKFAKSKWALVVLFIPLVISLAMFLPDNFNGSGLSGGTLSRIGGREVKVTDVDRDVQQMIDQIRVEEGRVISPAEAAREGRVNAVLQGLEFRNILLAYGDKVGIRASEASLKPYLERNKILVNEFGKLSRDQIIYQAAQRRQSPREYENYIRDYLTQDYILKATGAALDVPDVLSQPWINYLGERRTLTFAQVTAATAATPAEPTDAELQAWYDSHKQNFLQPERRRISVLTYTPDDFIDKVELTDEQVRAEYEKRIKEYSTPETRVVVEFESENRNTVQAFVDLAMQGISADLALAQTPGITRKEMTVKPTDVEDEAYRNFLFALPVNQVHNNPVQTKEGEPFKTMMVSQIIPGVATPLEQIAAKVRRDVAWNDAIALFEASGDPFRDAAGGQPLEEIATQFGFPVVMLGPVDQQGLTLYRDQAKLLTQNVDALRQLFTLAPGDMTNVFEGDNVRSMFRLDEIVAPYTQPLADVKEAVKRALMTEKMVAARDKAAEDMVAAVKGGAAFDKAAASVRMAALPPLPILRADNAPVDPAVVTGGFALKAGEVALVRGGDNNPWVVRVEKIEPVTPEIATRLRAQLGAQVSESLIDDIREVFVRGLQAEVEYKRDDAAIETYLKTVVGDAAQQ